MTRTEVQQLPHGLYEVFWVGGGSSLASVGSNAKGQRWMAPTNWVNLRTDTRKMTDHWQNVEYVRLLRDSATRQWPPEPGTDSFNPEEN